MSGSTAYWLYLVFGLGAVAVHAMLPRRHPVPAWFGAAIGLIALGSLFVVLAWRVVVADSTTASFYLFAGLAIGASARVITHSKPVYSALYFVLAVVAAASLLVLLQAEFLAVATIIIYAGAILVTYLFVIMLAQQSGAPAYDRNAREPFASVVAGFVLMAAIAGHVSKISPTTKQSATLVAVAGTTPADAPIPEGNTASIGSVLLTKHVVATELAAVLLLISMVGAIALSKKRISSEVVLGGPAVGQVGREVQPF